VTPGWTQPLCWACWERRNPGRKPAALVVADLEQCCDCGGLTQSGIYVRVDPATVRFPQETA
jgi:hypothetical protein